MTVPENLPSVLLDGNASKPSFLERITPRAILKAFGITFAASSLSFVVLCLLGMAFFTAKDSDVPWWLPLMVLNTGLWMLSGVGLGASLLVACIQRLQRG